VVQADAGNTLTVAVSGSKSGYASVTVVSKPTKLVTGGRLSSSRPIISGTPLVGHLLVADAQKWGPAPVSLTFQWFRDGRKISGATGPSYQIVAPDRGARIAVAVTGHKPGFGTDTEVSTSVKVAR
jgi:hypothetical protein